MTALAHSAHGPVRARDPPCVAGMPLVEGLRLTHNALLGTGVRKHVKLIASGRVFSGMGIVRKIALGARASTRRAPYRVSAARIRRMCTARAAFAFARCR